MDSGKIQAVSFIVVHMVILRHLITSSWSVHIENFRMLCDSRGSWIYAWWDTEGFLWFKLFFAEYSIQCNTEELYFGNQYTNKSHNFVTLCSRHSKCRKANWTNFFIIFWTFKFFGIWLRVLSARPVQPPIKSRIQCPSYVAFFGTENFVTFCDSLLQLIWRDVTVCCGLISLTAMDEQSWHKMRNERNY